MEKVPKERVEKILERIEKAGSEEYETSWDEKGLPIISKKKAKVKQGRTSRARGAKFELKVREDLENKGRVVDKWTNNVDLIYIDEEKKKIDLEKSKVIPVKRRFIPIKQGRNTNPFITRIATIGTGFPDFISIKHIHDDVYSVIGVECKINGMLSKIEKEKCAFYLKNKTFSNIWIAKQGAPKGVPPKSEVGGKKRGTIEYDDFAEKYGKKFDISSQ